MPFTENWFPLAKRERLLHAMQLVTAEEGIIVEVGSWQGRSTVDICKFFYPETVHVIDHWMGDLHNITSAKTGRPLSGLANLAASRDVYSEFLQNMKLLTRGNYEVHKMDWREYEWGEPIKFCFIDADHSYDEVRDNIEAVDKLIVPGGVLAGDDIQYTSVWRAIRDSIGFEGVENIKGQPGREIWWKVYE